MSKKYLSLQLNPVSLLPLWILFLCLVLAPYLLEFAAFTARDNGEYPVGREFFLIRILYLVIISLGYLVFNFYLIQKLLEGISLDGEQLKLEENFWNYAGIIIIGTFLSVITLGIYIPWFMKHIMQFFTNNTRYRDKYFSFHGKGSSLFRIFLIWGFIPIFLFALLIGVLTAVLIDVLKDNQHVMQLMSYFSVVLAVTMYFFLIPLAYWSFKWRTQTFYDDYQFKVYSKFIHSWGFLSLQLLLTLVTLGIYLPMAVLKVYEYFWNKTVAENDKRLVKFGFNTDFGKSYLYILVHFLFIIISIGFYYPWAVARIGNHILERSYIEPEDKTLEEELANENNSLTFAHPSEEIQEETTGKEVHNNDPY